MTKNVQRTKRPAHIATLVEALTKIAHMRYDGDDWFGDEDGADITNDHLQSQMVEAVQLARMVLKIDVSGPTREPTDVGMST